MGNQSEITNIDKQGLKILIDHAISHENGDFTVVFDPLNNEWIKLWKDGHKVTIRRGR